jgi:pimeloyl-ACP methyl ester carboxylesterase
MTGSIGPIEKFKDRWEGDNNLAKRIKELKVPLYIGHGLSDKVCPVIQSKSFSELISKELPSIKLKTHFPENMGHNYTYWNSEVDSVLSFFSELVPAH